MTATEIKIKQAKESHPLAPAVLRQLGGGQDAIQSALDAAERGAYGGISGFIYYSETCDFTKRNRKAIASAVEDMAESLGESPIEMVKGFNCLEGSTDREVAAALYGGNRSECESFGVDQVENALAWFALEEVGNAIDGLV